VRFDADASSAIKSTRKIYRYTPLSENRIYELIHTGEIDLGFRCSFSEFPFKFLFMRYYLKIFKQTVVIIGEIIYKTHICLRR